MGEVVCNLREPPRFVKYTGGEHPPARAAAAARALGCAHPALYKARWRQDVEKDLPQTSRSYFIRGTQIMIEAGGERAVVATRSLLYPSDAADEEERVSYGDRVNI